MSLKPLNGDEMLEHLQGTQSEHDSELCRQVRDMLALDLTEEGQFDEYRAVLQPVDGEPLYVNADSLDHLSYLCHEHESVEVMYTIKMNMALEKYDGQRPESEMERQARSPTVQYLKELAMAPGSMEEKLKEVKESWLTERVMLIRAEAIFSECWIWMQEHGVWVYGGVSDNSPANDTNPYMFGAKKLVETLAHRDGQNEFEYLSKTVLSYNLSKHLTDRNPWSSGPEVSWVALNLMVYNLEVVVLLIEAGANCEELFIKQKSQELMKDSKGVIMGGVSMFEDLLDSREHFKRNFPGMSEQGLRRAWSNVKRRVDSVRQLMQEMSEKNDKKNGTNN